jgi:hypothetical protein
VAWAPPRGAHHGSQGSRRLDLIDLSLSR